jgi:hypothetical protein
VLKDCLYENNWERRVDGGDVSDGRASANSMLDLNDRDTHARRDSRMDHSVIIHSFIAFTVLYS